MYIKRVVLSNIKGFKEAELDLCPDGSSYAGWAVVTGDNGAGKTAFLRAIALAVLGPDQGRAIAQDLTGWVTAGESRGTASVEVRPDSEYDRTLKGGYPIKGTFWSEIEIAEQPSVWVIDSADVYRNKRKSAINGPWPPSTPGWFMVGYGPFRRLYGSSADAQRMMVIPGRGARFATLFHEGATLGEGEEWIKDLQFKRLDLELRGREEFGPDKQTLESLLRLVGEDFLRNGVQIEEIDATGIWLRDAGDRRIALSDMSEGYRAALAMLVDIFRHMVATYGPDIVARSDDGHHFVDRPGVVLIDEVDAHLHPDWQRDIGFWLQRHFPQVQFVVTTHSPLVCAAADGGRIYHLPQPTQGEPFQLSREDYERVITGKADEILLTPAFGMANTRSPRAVSSRRRHALLVSKRIALGTLPEEEQHELEQLELFASVE